jgi:lysyl-tRNA synthetase class 2
MALSEQEILRREALSELRNLGIEPYPANEFLVTARSSDIHADYEKFDGKEVILAGRLMGKRIMGKASFAELKDSEGRIQVYISRDDISADE